MKTSLHHLRRCEHQWISHCLTCRLPSAKGESQDNSQCSAWFDRQRRRDYSHSCPPKAQNDKPTSTNGCLVSQMLTTSETSLLHAQDEKDQHQELLDGSARQFPHPRSRRSAGTRLRKETTDRRRISVSDRYAYGGRTSACLLTCTPHGPKTTIAMLYECQSSCQNVGAEQATVRYPISSISSRSVDQRRTPEATALGGAMDASARLYKYRIEERERLVGFLDAGVGGLSNHPKHGMRCGGR